MSAGVVQHGATAELKPWGCADPLAASAVCTHRWLMARNTLHNLHLVACGGGGCVCV